MQRSNRASMLFTLEWQSEVATHKDCHFAEKVDFWRDVFPDGFEAAIESLELNTQISVQYDAGKLVEPFSKSLIKTFPERLFNRSFSHQITEPRVGRFYPIAMAAKGMGCFEGDYRPFRIIAMQDETITGDLNHALAKYPLKLSAVKTRELKPMEQRGGVCFHIGEIVTEKGPGFQVPLLKDGKIESMQGFVNNQPFTRMDENKDELFYSMPRIIQHIDNTASQKIAELYAEIFDVNNHELHILDLMSSHMSHLPETKNKVTGLGMNQEELKANPLLADFIIQDLNENAVLPYDENSFDYVMCNLSIEYLTKPLDVMKEVARVLKRGGLFVVTFSDRWFPPKAITLWTQIHPFERVQLVTEYFLKSGEFNNLNTYSIRGLPRPSDDKYQTSPYSDPVFAVWGTTV